MTVRSRQSGVNVAFMHDTIEALSAAAHLVNTRPAAGRDDADGLAAPTDLDAFLERHPYSGAIRRDRREVDELRAIRDDLAAFWELDRDSAPAHANALLERGHALPRLVRHDGLDWHIHAVDADAPLAVRVLVETAMAAVDVIRADEWSRLRCCAADDCANVLVDLSRNRSKQYCDSSGCGNRLHVSAYRERRAGRQ